MGKLSGREGRAGRGAAVSARKSLAIRKGSPGFLNTLGAKTGVFRGGAPSLHRFAAPEKSACSEKQVLAGVFRLGGKAQAHFAQCAFVTECSMQVLCISQSRSFGSAAMARAVSVLVAAVMESAASTSSTFKTLERLPRMSIFSLRIGSSMMGLMSVRESSMPAMALMALSTQEEQALIRLLALPLRSVRPAAGWPRRPRRSFRFWQERAQPPHGPPW